MITITKLENEEYVLVEEFTGDISELLPRLQQLREDGNEYRAEQTTDCFSLIFDL